MLKLKKNSMMNILNESLFNLPTPSFISYKWNFGFILGMILMMQLITGLFLTMHYNPSINGAFNSLIDISRNVNEGWIYRLFHSNGASLFFIFIYIHLGRGMYYMSFSLKVTWNLGVMIILPKNKYSYIIYVLPWGQMSFWGATVITNLLSVVPYLGKFLVEWIWGGFSVNNPTLNRFYTFHFLLPFIIMLVVMLHLIFLHNSGSQNPLGINSNLDKLNFHPYFTLKDTFSFLLVILIFIFFVVQFPLKLSDPENFIYANPLITPEHIQPEWYLLFAYSILRSIPNKLGGVIALLMSVIIYCILTIMKNKINSNMFILFNKMIYFNFIFIIMILTWLGACPVESPYIMIGQIFTFFYFLYFVLIKLINMMWFKILY
uniref:Cytochrome b n=1 Tax=Acerella muscorum TaxID=187596 RepID=A0A0C4K5K4_9HEXA|nr:cytochrome b [Acerella muscorum]AHL42964.1 cytochrome b [Acerella muscorum]